MNYFLKLLCLFWKHKRCQVGKIYQFLTINQLKIQITENLKCQQRPWKPVPSIQQNWNSEEELYYFTAKNGWEG